MDPFLCLTADAGVNTAAGVVPDRPSVADNEMDFPPGLVTVFALVV